MAGNPYSWSTTAATNSTADADINWAEGQLPSTVNNSARAMMAGVAGWLKDTNSTLTTGGSANVQTVTSNIPIASLASGIRLHVKAGFTNTTAAVTLNLTPLGGAAFGAKPIKIVTGAAEFDPGAGQITLNGHYILEYDAAANGAVGAWILLNPSGSIVFTPFTTTATYTPSPGMKFCIVEAVGPGGGGGGSVGSAGQTYTAGGGGAGGYSRSRLTAVQIGTNKTATIGTGGAGGAGNNDGSAGSADTSLGSLVIAKAGSGGKRTTSGTNGAGGAGGVAGTGDIAIPGNAGQGGFFNSANITIVHPAGQGGAGPWGGAPLALVAEGTGNVGGGVGSGGGGAETFNTTNNATGGAGANGYIIITEYI